MRISEYRLLEEAYERHFGFMLNRLEDAGWLSPKGIEREYLPLGDVRSQASDEFFNALDEMGVELQDMELPIRCRCHVGRQYKKENQ